MKNIYFLFLIITLAACENEKGKVKVINKVHNVKLESISWGDYSICSLLITGEECRAVTIEDKKGSFPKIHDVSFFMVSGTKKVYLKTKQTYQLDADKTITIEITDSTGVTNPAL